MKKKISSSSNNNRDSHTTITERKRRSESGASCCWDMKLPPFIYIYIYHEPRADDSVDAIAWLWLYDCDIK